MKKQDKHYASNDSENSTKNNWKSERKSRNRKTARQGIPEKSIQSFLENDLLTMSLLTDKDNVVSQQQLQQQQQGMFGTTAHKDKWEQNIASAMITWSELTEYELQQSRGQVQKLISLLQERYAITRNEAEKQVKDFFERCNSRRNSLQTPFSPILNKR